jgi:hypothetical protein
MMKRSLVWSRQVELPLQDVFLGRVAVPRRCHGLVVHCPFGTADASQKRLGFSRTENSEEPDERLFATFSGYQGSFCQPLVLVGAERSISLNAAGRPSEKSAPTS